MCVLSDSGNICCPDRGPRWPGPSCRLATSYPAQAVHSGSSPAAAIDPPGAGAAASGGGRSGGSGGGERRRRTEWCGRHGRPETRPLGAPSFLWATTTCIVDAMASTASRRIPSANLSAPSAITSRRHLAGRSARALADTDAAFFLCRLRSGRRAQPELDVDARRQPRRWGCRARHQILHLRPGRRWRADCRRAGRLRALFQLHLTSPIADSGDQSSPIVAYRRCFHSSFVGETHLARVNLTLRRPVPISQPGDPFARIHLQSSPRSGVVIGERATRSPESRPRCGRGRAEMRPGWPPRSNAAPGRWRHASAAPQ